MSCYYYLKMKKYSISVSHETNSFSHISFIKNLNIYIICKNFGRTLLIQNIFFNLNISEFQRLQHE